MVDNRIPPLVIAPRRRAVDERPGVRAGQWILRAGHRPLFVRPLVDPPLAEEGVGGEGGSRVR